MYNSDNRLNDAIERMSETEKRELLNSLNIEMVDDIECPQGFTDGIVV